MGCGDDFGVIGQAEVIVGTMINDRERFPVVVDGGARFGGREKSWLVQFNGPRANMHPPGEAGRGLERIVALAS